MGLKLTAQDQESWPSGPGGSVGSASSPTRDSQLGTESASPSPTSRSLSLNKKGEKRILCSTD